MKPEGFRLEERVPLAPRTTLGVGGEARFFAEVRSEEEARAALTFARAEGLFVTVLGGGSNLLVADGGVSGLVLRAGIRGEARQARPDGRVLVDAGAGEPWEPFAERAVRAELAGLECLSGIPGDVGATPIQNVGAYGQEVSETIASVRALELSTGEAFELSPDECRFGYRDSVFKREAAGRFLVTRVRFALEPGGPPALRYAELSRELERRGQRGPSRAPSLAETRAAVLDLRRKKSMLFEPEAENGRSAGSFFTNPVVSEEEAARALGRLAPALAPGESPPRFPAGPGRVKLAAGWLIEKSGFTKGHGEGRVGLSTRHALAIVNRGGATASEVLDFAARIRAGVLERSGIALEPEPVLLGFSPEDRARLTTHP